MMMITLNNDVDEEGKNDEILGLPMTTRRYLKFREGALLKSTRQR